MNIYHNHVGICFLLKIQENLCYSKRWLILQLATIGLFMTGGCFYEGI